VAIIKMEYLLKNLVKYPLSRFMEEKREIKLEFKNLGYTPRRSENLLVTE
jgi:hypothetical protein